MDMQDVAQIFCELEQTNDALLHLSLHSILQVAFRVSTYAAPRQVILNNWEFGQKTFPIAFRLRISILAYFAPASSFSCKCPRFWECCTQRVSMQGCSSYQTMRPLHYNVTNAEHKHQYQFPNDRNTGVDITNLCHPITSMWNMVSRNLLQTARSNSSTEKENETDSCVKHLYLFQLHFSTCCC